MALSQITVALSVLILFIAALAAAQTPDAPKASCGAPKPHPPETQSIAGHGAPNPQPPVTHPIGSRGVLPIPVVRPGHTKHRPQPVHHSHAGRGTHKEHRAGHTHTHHRPRPVLNSHAGRTHTHQQPRPVLNSHAGLALQSFEKAYLDTTNAARAEAGVPSLVWNNTVADYARMWANKRAAGCVFEHSEDGPYAENIATGCCDFSSEDAVKMWVGEKKFYDPATQKCIGGNECGHYANIVASLTTDMGCARVKCDNDWIYMICDYWGRT